MTVPSNLQLFQTAQVDGDRSELQQNLITEGIRQIQFYSNQFLNHLTDVIPNAKTAHWAVVQEMSYTGYTPACMTLRLLRICLTDFKYFWKKVIDAGQLDRIADALICHSFDYLVRQAISTKVGNIIGRDEVLLSGNNGVTSDDPLSVLTEVLAEDIGQLFQLNDQVFNWNNEVQKLYDASRIRIMECSEPASPMVSAVVHDFLEELNELGNKPEHVEE